MEGRPALAHPPAKVLQIHPRRHPQRLMEQEKSKTLLRVLLQVMTVLMETRMQTLRSNMLMDMHLMGSQRKSTRRRLICLRPLAYRWVSCVSFDIIGTLSLNPKRGDAARLCFYGYGLLLKHLGQSVKVDPRGRCFMYKSSGQIMTLGIALFCVRAAGVKVCQLGLSVDPSGRLFSESKKHFPGSRQHGLPHILRVYSRQTAH